jgi:phage shock protein PspC (stress-responsive transcriptional regulator)
VSVTSDHSATLVRSRRNRMLGGVCGGLAEQIGVDPLLVRLVAVLLGLFSAGAVAVVYVVLWVLVPEAGPEPPALEAGAPAPATGAPATQAPALQATAADTTAADTTAADTTAADTTAADTTAADTTAAEPAAAEPAVAEPAVAEPRRAWAAVGDDLRALARDLRRSPSGATEAAPRSGAAADSRPAPVQAADRAMSTIGERLRTPDVQASARQVASRLSDAVRVSADDLRRRTSRS